MAQPVLAPTYEVRGEAHILTWPAPDGIQLEFYAPHEDRRGDLSAFAKVLNAQGALINEGLLKLLDAGDCQRFARSCTAANGIPPDVWQAKLGLGIHHVRETFEAARAARQPDPLRRPVTPPGPYPVAALGTVLSPMVIALQATVQAPDAICAQSVLAAGTLAVQPLADVEIDGRRFPASGYYIDIGESGERRSAVDRLALYPHFAHQRALKESVERDQHDYLNASEAYRVQRSQVLKGKGSVSEKEQKLKALGPAPDPPLEPLIICEEPTFEGLVKLLWRGQPSMGLFSDEGGRFLGGHGMRDETQQSTVCGLCELWDAKPLTRVRATDLTGLLYGKRVSMHLMVQPIIAESLFTNRLLLEQGLLARALVAWPQSTIGTRAYKAVDITQDSGVKAYNARMQTLLAADKPLAKGSRNELDPPVLRLSRQAKARWVRFHDHIEGQLKDGAALEGVRGFGNKLPEHAARLAAVLTLVIKEGAREIALEQMEAAITLAEFYAKEALRLFTAGGLDPDLTLAERLLAWAGDAAVIALADVYQRGPYALRDAKTARRIVGILEDHGYLTRIPGGTAVDGIQRRDVWRVWYPGELD